MTVKQGDFIMLDYTGATGGKVFDTTTETEAKKAGIYFEGRMYRPILIEAGKGDVIVGLDKVIVGMDKGAERKVTIEPKEAYGERSAELVKVIPLAIFTKNHMNPFPGMPVQLDGMTARVQSVSGGRVRVDFNHELAGRTLDFAIRVADIITTEADKIRALADQYFADGELAIEIKEKKIVATPKKEILTQKTYAKAKAYFITQVTDKFPDHSVEFVEEYKKA